MPVFRVERNKGYTVMSNHHLRNKDLTLKAKGLLSQMLSLPEDWDYTLKGLALINREKIDAIRQAIRELEQAGYIVRSRERDERGRLRGADYVIYEQPQTPPALDLPTLENPTLDNPTQEKPTLENPTQLNKDIQSKDPKITDPSITYSFPSLSPPPAGAAAAASPPERKGTEAATQSAVEIYRDIIKENIEYDHLLRHSKIDPEELDGIVELLVETVCTARKTIRVAGDDYPAELVKAKLLKLNSGHIEFVMDCMRENTTKIRNIKKYLLAVLFNAPSTMGSYGYMKDPEDKKHWIVDEEAAAIVQKIFSLCVDGLGPTQIAKWLQQNNILNPTAYAHEKGLPVCNAPTANPCKWTNETVSRILERVEYLGHTVNFKTCKPSFKSKKKVWNNPSEWVIFENTQEAIIEESVFLVVQNIRQARRRPTKMGDMGMFSGLVYCADCGGKMYLCRANHFKPEQEYYICSTYRKDRTLCKTHSIRRVVLEEIVLRNLREAISYVTQYEDDFIQRAAEQSLRERDKALAQKKAVLAQSEKRIAELDVIFKRIYEDNISGKLSDDRFIKLSRDYEQEQEQLKAVVETLGREVKQQEQKKTNIRKFISVVKKYTDMTQLDATILREFVEQIRVSDTYTTDEQQRRVKIREIEIVYNFIGAFDFEEAREQSQTAQDKNNAKVGAA